MEAALTLRNDIAQSVFCGYAEAGLCFWSIAAGLLERLYLKNLENQRKFHKDVKIYKSLKGLAPDSNPAQTI